MEPFSVGVPLKLRDSQKSNVGDWELEENLTKLHELFQSKVDTLKLCTEKVVNICSESLTASNIRHSPITHRIKKWDSAKGSIRRRHQERIVRARLRDAVGDRNRKWLDYCYESGLEPQEDEMEPFQNPAQMLSALHDFGGVRISLYFPGDVERVTAILGEKFKITRKSDKTQGSGGNVRSLQERINHLQDSKPGSSEVNGNTAISAQGHSQFARTFTGYKATHFVVRFLDTEIPADRSHSWKDVEVEIQVGTLVMHVWSEIEHDMIYKPQELQGEKISDDEERVLDLINGIVLTGEAALRQLEASTAKRLYQRAENKEAMASSYYELAAWIEKHCEVKGMPLSDGEWRLLSQLFSILKATGDHQHYKVMELFGEAVTSHTASRQTIPIVMLQALCKRSSCAGDPKPSLFDVMETVHHARFWALRLVHSLNLAIYLGVSEEFLNLGSRGPRPSIASFLDILHPSSPRYVSLESAFMIIQYCRSIVKLESRSGRVEGLLRVAMDLPKANRVVGTAEYDGYRRILVPGMISRLFPIENPDHVTGGNDEMPGMHVDDTESYRILDVIDSYLTHKGVKVDDGYIIWDLLMTPPINREHKRPIVNQIFVPRASPHDQSVGLWHLVDHNMELDIVKLDLYKEIRGVKTLFEKKQNVFKGHSNGILELAYSLYPESRWGEVYKVWRMAKSLRTNHVRFNIGPEMSRSRAALSSIPPPSPETFKSHEPPGYYDHQYDRYFDSSRPPYSDPSFRTSAPMSHSAAFPVGQNSISFAEMAARPPNSVSQLAYTTPATTPVTRPHLFRNAPNFVDPNLVDQRRHRTGRM
ncbi:hypothetical protein MGN70_003835 [Eutypa lata]|nr:hypothetical protein MGN70_003835 [Eutypa lata]